jgi:hypothetical protein
MQLGLADVAALANVQRPVVSMWRTRSAATALPFPPPIDVRNGQEWFDGQQVVWWLEATARGNNADAREDLAAFAGLDGGSPAGDETVFHGLTALLCLTAITGRPFGPAETEDVLDLADETDPDDELLYREIEALGNRIGPLAHYCDLLVNAAYNPVAALEKLIGERFRRYVPAQSTVALTEAAHRLIGEAAVALADEAGLESLTVVDPTHGGSDLLVAVHARAGGRSLTVVTDRSDDPAGRLARRRLRVHDVHRAPELGSAEPGDQPDEAILLGRFPSPGEPTMPAPEILEAIGQFLLGTSERQRFLVLAPAAVLTERLREPRARLARDLLLRFPTLRAVVRLPAGLVVSRPRERLALMMFGRRHGSSSAEEQQLMIGDMSNVRLDAAAIDGLVTDLVASTASPVEARSHRSRFLRAVVVRRVLAWTGSIVEVASTVEPPRPVGADLVVWAAELAERIGGPLPSPELPGIELSEAGESAPAGTTLGTAKDREEVRILPGLRLAGDVEMGGGVRVLGVPELAGVDGPADRSVDRLGVVERHPQVQFTEAGDVVFCSAPRPAALVDIEGGSVVVFPARVARISDSRASVLTPHLLAADINALPAEAKAWRAWPIRRVPGDAGAVLDRSLAEIESCRAALDRRRHDLDDLAQLLARGAADGSFILTSAATDPTKGT